MPKLLLFIATFAYMWMAKTVASSITELRLELRPENLFHPNRLVLALVETGVIMFIAFKRWEVSNSGFSQGRANVECWIKGLCLLIGVEFLINSLMSLVTAPDVVETLELLLEHAKIYGIVMIPVAVWGGIWTREVW